MKQRGRKLGVTFTGSAWTSSFGGTFAGVGQAIKQARPEVKRCLAEPMESPMASGMATEPHLAFRMHPIQGWAPDFIAKILDAAATEQVTTKLWQRPVQGLLTWQGSLLPPRASSQAFLEEPPCKQPSRLLRMLQKVLSYSPSLACSSFPLNLIRPKNHMKAPTCVLDLWQGPSSFQALIQPPHMHRQNR